MKHLAAYILLVLGGNLTPSAQDVKNLLKEVGSESDDAQLEILIKSLQGKQLHEIIQ